MTPRSTKHALLAGCIWLAAAGAALAQQPARGFTIPAQSLDSALARLAQASGRNILFAPETVKGVVSAPVVDAASFDEAMRQMLAGTGVEETVSGGTVIVRRRAPHAGLIRASTAAAPASAVAADPERPQVSEVTVTARKRVERLQDVPLAVTAISGAAFNAGEHLRIEELNQLAPSTNIVIINAHSTSFSIRGLGANPNNDGLEQSAGVFLDGVYLSRPGMAATDLIDIDQVELLRGPQGTLFGKNTTAGAINITTASPASRPSGTLQLTGGNLGYFQAQGTVTGPLVGDVLSGRLTGYFTRRDGWVHDTTTGEDLESIRRFGVRGQLLFTPNDDFKLRLIAEHHESDDSNNPTYFNSWGIKAATWQKQLAAVGGEVVISPDGDETAGDQPVLNRTRQTALTAQADWKVGGVTLTSITGWRKWTYWSIVDNDGSSVNVLNGGQNLYDDQFSQELRIATPSDAPVEVVGGAFFFAQHIKPDQTTFYGQHAAAYLSGVPEALLPVYAQLSPQLATLMAYNNSRWDLQADAKTRSYALFGQGTWHATPKLDVTLGLRETYERKTETVWQPNPIDTLTGRPNPALASQAHAPLNVGVSDWAPSGLLSVDYKVARDVMVYASASQGEKAGGVSTTLPPSGLGADSLKVKPEIAQDFEAGLKGQFFDNRLRLNVSAFYTKVRDYQATYFQPVPGSLTYVQVLTNVGRVRSRGVEVELASRPIDGLDLNFSGSYNDATYTSYTNGPCPIEVSATFCDLTGKPVMSAPRWVTNLSGSYEHRLAERMDGYGRFEYSWRSSSYGYLDDSAYSRIADYGLLNLRIGIRRPGGAWDLSVWAKNLTDVRFVRVYASYGGLIPGAYVPEIGDPRTWGVTLRTSF